MDELRSNESADLSRRGFLLLALGLGVLHGLLAGVLPLSGDEAYYWDCSRHPDWSYFDQPALVIWAIAPFRWLFGETALAARMPAVAASFAMAFLLSGLVRRLGGTRRQAAGIYLLLHAMPLYFLGSFYASTDVAMATAYVGATWAAVAVAQGERRAWWGFGAACGLGFLAKFPIVVVAPALLPALARKTVRAQLATVTPWLAGLGSLLLTAPAWIWARQHDWANIVFQLQGRHSGGALRLEYVGEFLAGNLLLATPFLFAALIAAWCFSLNKREPAWWGLRVATVMPFLFFGFAALRERVGLHWGAPGLVLGLVLVGLVEFRGRRWLIGLGAAFGLVISLAVVGLALFPEPLLDAPESLGELPVEDLGKLIGNGEIAAEVARRFRPGELVVSESYSWVHQLAFLSDGQLPTRLADVRGGSHGLASLYWHRPEDLRGTDALAVTERPEIGSALREIYSTCEALEPIRIERRGKLVREIALFRCRDLLEPSPALTRLE